MSNPGYVNLGLLPADTITQEANSVTLAITGAPDGSRALVPQLIVSCEDLGVYRFTFGREVLTSLIRQALWFSDLSGDQLQAITDDLTGTEGDK